MFDILYVRSAYSDGYLRFMPETKLWQMNWYKGLRIVKSKFKKYNFQAYKLEIETFLLLKIKKLLVKTFFFIKKFIWNFLKLLDEPLY